MTGRKRQQKTSAHRGRMDRVLLVLVTILTLFGVLMVYDASVVEAYQEFLDKFYFAKQQLVWALGGLGLMLGISVLPARLFRKVSLWAFVVNLVLLVLVLVPGIGVKALGARRWLTVGSLTVQPAELVKLTLSLYLASYFSSRKRFLPFAISVSAVVFLVLLEPDLGTAVLISTIALSIYFMSGAPLKLFIPTVLTAALAGVLFIASSQYRRARVATFLNPRRDPLGASYHILQILIALGSGGWFGLGLGRSRQKYQYIPAATTDSIFAIIAEEVGFIGASLVVVLMAMVVARMFTIARSASDEFSRILAAGVSTWIGAQALLNLATMVALVPLTGVPLPFISYGGSSTIATLTAIGMVLSISRSVKHSH